MERGRRTFEDAVTTNAAMNARPWLAHTRMAMPACSSLRHRAHELLAAAISTYRDLRLDNPHYEQHRPDPTPPPGAAADSFPLAPLQEAESLPCQASRGRWSFAGMTDARGGPERLADPPMLLAAPAAVPILGVFSRANRPARRRMNRSRPATLERRCCLDPSGEDRVVMRVVVDQEPQTAVAVSR